MISEDVLCQTHMHGMNVKHYHGFDGGRGKKAGGEENEDGQRDRTNVWMREQPPPHPSPLPPQWSQERWKRN